MTKRFSERIGAVEPNLTIQTNSMSTELRNSLWNFIHFQFDSYPEGWISLSQFIAMLFRKVPVDDLLPDDLVSRIWVKEYFFSLKWYEAYDLIEFLVKHNCQILRYPQHGQEKLEEICNSILQSELSGFRFISGVLAPISSPTETQAISQAIEAAADIGLDGAHAHLKSALEMLGQKPNPDYRNSIKESISSVESVAKKISKSKSNGLDGAFSALEKKLKIHGALKKGLLSLYGYTSDSDGIRHAILEEPDVGFDEAKYMLVSCSAFVNYLISKAASAGLLEPEDE